MRALVAAVLTALTACSSPQPSNTAADVNAAAEAQGDIDTYAADTLAATAPSAKTPQSGGSPGVTAARSASSPLEIAPERDAAAVHYRCAGEIRISVRFDHAADTAIVRNAIGEEAVLDGQRPGSGIWYKRDGYELRGKGDAADFTAPGQPPVACTAVD